MPRKSTTTKKKKGKANRHGETGYAKKKKKAVNKNRSQTTKIKQAILFYPLSFGSQYTPIKRRYSISIQTFINLLSLESTTIFLHRKYPTRIKITTATFLHYVLTFFGGFNFLTSLPNLHCKSCIPVISS